MKTLSLAPVLLLASLAAAPAAAQAVPDWIPDDPGESPADRAQERLEERFRGTLSRFFATGGFDLAPIGANGMAYQANVNVGMNLSAGDAVYLFASAREMPGERDVENPLRRAGTTAWYVGGGYQLGGERFLPPSELARRSAINFGAGAMEGYGFRALALEAAPTYHLLRGDAWSVPVGLKFSLTAFQAETGTRTPTVFVGLSLGLKHHFGRRDRLESRHESDADGR